MTIATMSAAIDYQNLVDALERGFVDPHAWLGVHAANDRQYKSVIRVWRPGAPEVYVEVNSNTESMQQVHPAGLFEWYSPVSLNSSDYRIWHTSGLCARDPYSFMPAIPDLDRYLFNSGVHYRLYDVMGGRLVVKEGVEGALFTVWAPSARHVALVGDFNHWDGRANPMRSLGSSGIWELFVPGLKSGDKYKFEIRSQQGQLFLKADPYALSSELRPQTASVLCDVHSFQWHDSTWLKQREMGSIATQPMLTYEVHLGSWKTKDGGFLNYRELAVELAAYCQTMGFTHVELMPIQEHPLDESWGYQVSGYYSVTSRFGSPEDFQWFVNHMHQHNIGVILDWVPGHFPVDSFSLGRFDGTALYEHEDRRLGFHPHWHTHIFNFGRHEVVNFLIANALYWFDVMHIDGLRVDAVASMLYLDYGREEGEWIANSYGGRENLAAIEFLKHLNSIVHDRFPGILMIAEESTAFPGITHDVQHGGLGFDMKWNMGWMNDTLHYFSKDMLFRHYHHNDLTFGLLYAFSERFALVLSHDEVVHGKNSLISKMPGDLWQKFANLRLLYSYMICQPGKKLLFMGGEIAQWNEWNCKCSIEWDLLKFPYHSGVQRMVAEINQLYLAHNALWEKDTDYTGFEWVDFSDQCNSVISYLRKSSNSVMLCVHNFTPVYYPRYSMRLGNIASIREVFNSDASHYGGADNLNHAIDFDNHHVHITLAPLATMVFEVHFHC
jgi:1,4-alpha-glucan branching enzyme